MATAWTTCVVAWPIAMARGHASPPAPKADVSSCACCCRHSRNPPMRILIVDDEPLARARLAALLGECHDVEVAGSVADGEAALEALGDLQPDVLLLDINMPGMSG